MRADPQPQPSVGLVCRLLPGVRRSKVDVLRGSGGPAPVTTRLLSGSRAPAGPGRGRARRWQAGARRGHPQPNPLPPPACAMPPPSREPTLFKLVCRVAVAFVVSIQPSTLSTVSLLCTSFFLKARFRRLAWLSSCSLVSMPHAALAASCPQSK